MKKFYSLLFTICIAANVNANTVTVMTAQNVSKNFYSQNSSVVPTSIILAFTERDPDGNPVYYAFNINSKDGFVIVSADDNAHPIIGYATTGRFVDPTGNSSFTYWMNMRKNEIIAMRAGHFLANYDITNEWTSYINNTQLNSSRSTNSVAQLCQTTWDQGNNGGFYNAQCPTDPSLPDGGNSTTRCVTGCVATAMAQIMKFWSYPATGNGSSSYCDCTSGGFSNQYGTLSANYGTSSYNWANMPLNVTSANADVAKIMYQCGVSVQMDYGPDGSGSTVFWNPQSYMGAGARTSYVRYFKYDSTTIHGYSKSDYNTDAAWITLLENELNIGRPIQYLGDDASPNQGGGHSWVCDGYDANNNFHMNWGWGGFNNGMYTVGNLTTGSGSTAFNPINTQQALLGIKPLVQNIVDAGVASIVSPLGIVCSGTFSPIITIKNYGAITLTSCTVKYKLDNGSISTYSYNGSLATNATVNITLPSITTTSGAHTLTTYTSSPNNTTDGNISNDSLIYHLTVNAVGGTLPLSEGFESSANLPANWVLNNPDADAAWQVSTTVGHTGTHSIAFNNYDGDGTTVTTGKIDRFYTSTYNFTGVTSPNLKFDVAYGPLNGNPDSLEVYYSTNCGSSWTSIYLKSGLTLGTTGGYVSGSTGFTPTSTQWRTETVNISTLTGQSNVMFAFENRSGYGNWIFVDNINIAASTTNVAPTGNFLASDSTVCVGQCISYTDQSTGSPTSWSWTFTGASTASSTSQSPTNICYNTVGNYSVTLVATNNNGSNTKTKTSYITVTALPATPTITQAGNVLTSSTATSYQWNLNGTPISGATSQTKTATVSGSYSVTITNAAGCSSTSAPKTVTLTTGIDNLTDDGTSVIIYPNPFSTSATIGIQSTNGSLQSSELSFILYDLVGKEVMRKNNIDAQTPLFREQLSNGLYFYKVFYQQKLIGKGKVVIQ